MVGYVLRYMQITDRLKEYLSKDRINLLNSMYCCPNEPGFTGTTSRFENGFFTRRCRAERLWTTARICSTRLRYLMGDLADLYSIVCNCVMPKNAEYTWKTAMRWRSSLTNGVPGVHSHSWDIIGGGRG
jgi:hypothetical protein